MSLTMTLNGAAIDMGTVEFNTTVMHGRSARLRTYPQRLAHSS